MKEITKVLSVDVYEIRVNINIRRLILSFVSQKKPAYT